eukprot:CAMPEP_0119066578 /NCGR_PEP_ID=MMETSP1178-20130426/9094_1 /TAXON_ID=33656 /ORGANISM="unid sp, Strain CCMP2000" /LENGTH=369 /DNA_ID=CAMNT_0007048187 /DNA_START=31 /DNA_END=1140 /DNA_ORIENTATION=-
MPTLLVNLALLGLHLAPCPPKMTHTVARGALTMQINDGGESKEIMDGARDEAEIKADEAADAAGAAARAAISDTRARAEAAVAALRAEIDAADGAHAVTKMLGKKGSLSAPGELADALRKPEGTIAIIAQGAPVESVSLGGFDLDDPVYLSGEFRRGNAAAVCVDCTPELRLSANALKGTADEQQTAMGEFPGPVLVIARDDFIDDVQLAQAAADGATAVILPLQLNGEEQTGALMAAAAELGLDTLVRVGDEAEAEAAVRLGASVVAIGDLGVPAAAELRQTLPVEVVSVSDCILRDDEAIRDTWRVRDLGFNAVILGKPLMRTCARERCPPTAVLKAMLAKGSVKFGLGMKLGRMEGAKETLGSLAM